MAYSGTCAWFGWVLLRLLQRPGQGHASGLGSVGTTCSWKATSCSCSSTTAWCITPASDAACCASILASLAVPCPHGHASPPCVTHLILGSQLCNALNSSAQLLELLFHLIPWSDPRATYSLTAPIPADSSARSCAAQACRSNVITRIAKPLTPGHSLLLPAAHGWHFLPRSLLPASPALLPRLPLPSASAAVHCPPAATAPISGDAPAYSAPEPQPAHQPWLPASQSAGRCMQYSRT